MRLRSIHMLEILDECGPSLEIWINYTEVAWDGWENQGASPDSPTEQNES